MNKNQQLSLVLIGCAFFLLGIDLLASYFGKGNIAINGFGAGFLVVSIVVGGQGIAWDKGTITCKPFWDCSGSLSFLFRAFFKIG